MAGGGHLHANLTIGQRDLNAGMVRMFDVDPRDANVFILCGAAMFETLDGGAT